MTDFSIKLNHPWSIYLQEPLSGYTNYEIYYSELLRLLDFVQDLSLKIGNIDEQTVQLTNIIIGTPMEDAINKKNIASRYKYQWQQLFPCHITEFIKHYSKTDNNININIIIISPDDNFMDEKYNEPLFLSNHSFIFTKIKNREYIHINEKLTIKVDIFTCPFPQLETNKLMIEKNNNLIIKLPLFSLTTFEPSETDIEFITNFYRYLEIIASNPLSNLIINSYATFRNVSGYDNFGLFPSLLELANKYKIIATEWIFSEENYFSKIVSKINYTVDYINYSISYIDPDYTDFEIDFYEKISISYIKENRVDIKNKKIKICLLIEFPYNKIEYYKIIPTFES